MTKIKGTCFFFFFFGGGGGSVRGSPYAVNIKKYKGYMLKKKISFHINIKSIRVICSKKDIFSLCQLISTSCIIKNEVLRLT